MLLSGREFGIFFGQRRTYCAAILAVAILLKLILAPS